MNSDTNLKSERCDEEDGAKKQTPLEMLLELQQQALAIDADDIVYDIYDTDADGDVISDTEGEYKYRHKGVPRLWRVWEMNEMYAVLYIHRDSIKPVYPGKHTNKSTRQ